MGVSKIDQSLSGNNKGLPTMEFTYRNYRGEVSNRKVQDPQKPFYGTSPFHEGEQWFLRAFDVDKQDFRDFAVKDILLFI